MTSSELSLEYDNVYRSVTPILPVKTRNRPKLEFTPARYYCSSSSSSSSSSSNCSSSSSRNSRLLLAICYVPGFYEADNQSLSLCVEGGHVGCDLERYKERFHGKFFSRGVDKE